MPGYPDNPPTIQEFNKLIDDLLEGASARSKFRPWEIQILLDIEACEISGASRRERILRQYQKTVQRQMEKGAATPLKLSEYLESTAKKPAAEERPRPKGSEQAS